MLLAALRRRNRFDKNEPESADLRAGAVARPLAVARTKALVPSLAAVSPSSETQSTDLGIRRRQSMRVLRLASLMSALEPSTTRRSAGALRRLAGGDGADAPAKLAAALQNERWRVQEIEACKDASGKGPLHFAAWRGSPKNCEILIDAGCDVEAPATGEFSYGKTPLFFAVTRCRDATVLALLERGAATKIVNNKGQSVRALARSHLKPETYAAIVAAEEKDTRAWINWRETKSDGLTYGDLDVRFLERPLEPRDVVDDVAVNPTTHISRRGAFLRKNPQRQQKV